MRGGWRIFAGLLLVLTVTGLSLVRNSVRHGDSGTRRSTTTSSAWKRKASSRTRSGSPQWKRRLVSGFSILRTKAESPPRRIVSITRKSPYKLDWRAAQRLSLPGAADLWIVPGHRFLCILSPARDGSVNETCVASSYALRSGVASVSITETSRLTSRSVDRRIVGLLPDGSKGVRVETNGVFARPTVHGNAFRLHDSNPAPPDLIAPL